MQRLPSSETEILVPAKSTRSVCQRPAATGASTYWRVFRLPRAV
jgi:hypothetical protein